MNKTTYYLFCCILALYGCAGKKSENNTADKGEAKIIAEKITTPDSLLYWVGHYKTQGNKASELLVRQKYGSVLRNISNFEEAIRQHDTCINIAEKLKDTLQLIIAYNNQGTNFRRLSDLEEASNNHYAALELCDKTMADTCFLARKNRVRTYNGLGNVMLSLGNDSVAESLFRRALQGETELESNTGQAINLANIGAIKEKAGETDSARIYYNMSMQKNVAAKNSLGISLCYQYLGNLDKKSGNTSSAMDNYRKSYELGKSTYDMWHWLKPCEAMASLFLDEHKTDSARKYINIALDAAIKTKSTSHLSHVHALCARLHEMNGRHDMALSNIRLAQAYKDSAAIESNQIHVQNLRVKYEVNKRTAEVERAETEARYEKRIRLIVTWASVIFFILIIGILLSLLRVSKERTKTYRILKKVDQERQEFYRGITHQLRTPLTVIAGMTDQLGKYLPAENTTAMQEYESLKRKCAELKGLINDMITFNRVQRTENREQRTEDREQSTENRVQRTEESGINEKLQTDNQKPGIAKDESLHITEYSNIDHNSLNTNNLNTSIIGGVLSLISL